MFRSFSSFLFFSRFFQAHVNTGCSSLLHPCASNRETLCLCLSLLCCILLLLTSSCPPPPVSLYYIYIISIKFYFSYHSSSHVRLACPVPCPYTCDTCVKMTLLSTTVVCLHNLQYGGVIQHFFKVRCMQGYFLRGLLPCLQRHGLSGTLDVSCLLFLCSLSFSLFLVGLEIDGSLFLDVTLRCLVHPPPRQRNGNTFFR